MSRQSDLCTEVTVLGALVLKIISGAGAGCTEILGYGARVSHTFITQCVINTGFQTVFQTHRPVYIAGSNP
jgi:hypothetical protein